MTQSLYLISARQLEILVTMSLSLLPGRQLEILMTLDLFFYTWKTWCYRGWDWWQSWCRALTWSPYRCSPLSHSVFKRFLFLPFNKRGFKVTVLWDDVFEKCILSRIAIFFRSEFYLIYWIKKIAPTVFKCTCAAMGGDYSWNIGGKRFIFVCISLNNRNFCNVHIC